MTLAYLKVVRVVRRSDLYRACSLFRIRIRVSDDRYLSADNRNDDLCSYESL